MYNNDEGAWELRLRSTKEAFDKDTASVWDKLRNKEIELPK